MRRKMGTFYTDCVVENHVDRSRKAEVRGLLVDTGSEFTWIAEGTLESIGLTAEKKHVRFVLANGQTASREVGFAVIRLQERFTTDEVVFARPEDLQIIGARTLEGLNLAVDPRKKKLVAAGPLPAAARVPA